MIYRDEVIIIKSNDIGETDKIFTVFGKRKGKFSFIAKGVRRAESKKGGHLQTFNICKISCARGKSLDILTEVESFYILDLKQLSSEEFERLGFVGLVLDKFLADSVPEHYLFDCTCDFLYGDLSENSTKSLLLKIIKTLGFGGEKQENLSYEKLILFIEKVLDRA